MVKTFHYAISLSALGIAIMAFCGNPFSICSDASLAIVGICTTLIVGLSIVDRLTIRDLESKIKHIEDTTRSLDLKSDHNKICFYAAWGLAYINWRPFAAFENFLRALKISFDLNDAVRAKVCLKLLDLTLDRLGILSKSTEVDRCRCDKIPKSIPEDLKTKDLYKVFSKDISKVFNEISKFTSPK